MQNTRTIERDELESLALRIGQSIVGLVVDNYGSMVSSSKPDSDTIKFTLSVKVTGVQKPTHAELKIRSTSATEDVRELALDDPRQQKMEF